MTDKTESVLQYLRDHDPDDKPLVNDLKKVGIEASGKEVHAAWKAYISDKNEPGESQSSDSTDKSELDEGPVPRSTRSDGMLMIRTKRIDRRWRAGMCFSRDPLAVSLADLTDELIDALRNDPALIVE